MAETFQIVGGAMACVDLALKAYKEIERFRIRVRQADEVGEEMAAKYGRLMKTIGDIHGAVEARKDQLDDQIPSEGEARVWVNIHDSLKGVRKAMRGFKQELEVIDEGRDVTKKRKWIDRAIWQLKLNKKAPVFDKLEEAANARIEELTLSLFSMQIFMHSETSSALNVLMARMEGIESSLRKVSSATRYRPVPSAVQSRRGKNKKQLRNCLQAAHDIVEKRGGSVKGSEQRRDSRALANLPEDDGASIWTDDGESLFEKPASPRRSTLQIAPTDLPPSGLGFSSPNRSPKSPMTDDFTDDTSDDDYDDLSEDSDDDSMTTDITNMDDFNESNDHFETAQNSLGTSTTAPPQAPRNDSIISSTFSNISCTGIEQRDVDPLMKAFKAKDAKAVRGLLRAGDEVSPARRVSITVDRVPLLHMAVRREAGPDVIDALFRSDRIDVNAFEPDEKKTALHWAVKYNRQSCCARLLQHSGIDLETQDKFGNTPLHFALHLSSHSDADVYTVVKLLLEAGANIPYPLPRGVSNTVVELVKKHEKRRRASSTSSFTTSPDLSRAETMRTERRSSSGSGNFSRRLTFGIMRSVSAKN